MTGFASKEYQWKEYSIAVIIKSLNSRYLDVRFRLPASLEIFEERMRKILKDYVNRGKVDVTVKVTAHEQGEFAVLKSMVERYFSMLERIEVETHTHFQVSLNDLFSLKNMINPNDEPLLEQLPAEKIENAFRDTMEEFQKSRRMDGDNTKKEILKYIREINSSMAEIERQCPAVIEKYKDQLKEKITELITNGVDETRVMIEVGIFASKMDISEEISRIKGHVHHMSEKMKSYGSCGRALDFIVQELTREINTIGSKVPDYSVSEQVVSVKSCLDKIKEQVRNIE
jgi:uncharacterized protein (TIGR00255 family)